MSREPTTKRIFGPEPWKVIAGVTFDYWDRWFLRLALEDAEGIDGLVRRFQAERTEGRASRRLDAESKLAHIEDLKARLAKIGESPRDVVGDSDASDKRLLAKAERKLFDTGLAYESAAMLDTRRLRLSARAIRGHWSEFPASPAPFERQLEARVHRQRDHDLHQTMWLSRDLAADVERIGVTVSSAAEQLALHRAAITVIFESMERVDDSGGDMATLFEDVWNAYLAMPRDRAGIAAEVFFRDLIEFTIWEDYGLVGDLAPFIRSVAPGDAPVVEQIVANLILELHDGGFARQEAKASRLRAESFLA